MLKLCQWTSVAWQMELQQNLHARKWDMPSYTLPFWKCKRVSTAKLIRFFFLYFENLTPACPKPSCKNNDAKAKQLDAYYKADSLLVLPSLQDTSTWWRLRRARWLYYHQDDAVCSIILSIEWGNNPRQIFFYCAKYWIVLQQRERGDQVNHQQKHKWYCPCNFKQGRKWNM